MAHHNNQAVTITQRLADILAKRSWHFRCTDGKGGTIILDREVDADTALKECRLSLGDKVIVVY